jgi:hypothetical protein
VCLCSEGLSPQNGRVNILVDFIVQRFQIERPKDAENDIINIIVDKSAED